MLLAKPTRLRVLPAARKVSVEDHLRAEEKSLCKHEYHNGIIKKMAGVTFNHDNLAGKIITLINVFLEENDLSYLVNGSDTKIRIEHFNKFVDLMQWWFARNLNFIKIAKTLSPIRCSL